jgi:hypothetical protein
MAYGDGFKVIVSDMDPPVPGVQRWCAYEDGREEAQEYGWGATPAQALRELADVLEERE